MNNSAITIAEILKVLDGVTSFSLLGNQDKRIKKIAKPEAADEFTLIWLSKNDPHKKNIAEATRAGVIICDSSFLSMDVQCGNKLLICCENPKLAFMRIANMFFVPPLKYGIHATVTIHPEAKVHANVYIGPYVYVGRCEIGEGTFIQGHAYLEDKVIIGKQVKIFAGCYLGVPNLGHVLNERNEYETFPHLGRVIIEDKVELGAGSIVGRGVLGDTHIGYGCKIDTQVIIGHNAILEEHVLIMPKAVVGGSAVIQKYTNIAMNATIADYVEVGAHAHIGPGAVVISNVPAGQRMFSRPALAMPADSRAGSTAT